MQVGIDWVAVVVLGAAWAFSQLRTVSVRLRYWVFSAACFGIAAYRLQQRGTVQTNLIFIGLAVVLGIAYLVRGLRAGGPQAE